MTRQRTRMWGFFFPWWMLIPLLPFIFLWALIKGAYVAIQFFRGERGKVLKERAQERAELRQMRYEQLLDDEAANSAIHDLGVQTLRDLAGG